MGSPDAADRSGVEVRYVYCTRCLKHHAVESGEEPCAPGSWLDHPPTEDAADSGVEDDLLRARRTLTLIHQMAVRGVGPDTTPEQCLQAIASFAEKRMDRGYWQPPDEDD